MRFDIRKIKGARATLDEFYLHETMLNTRRHPARTISLQSRTVSYGVERPRPSRITGRCHRGEEKKRRIARNRGPWLVPLKASFTSHGLLACLHRSSRGKNQVRILVYARRVIFIPSWKISNSRYFSKNCFPLLQPMNTDQQNTFAEGEKRGKGGRSTKSTKTRNRRVSTLDELCPPHWNYHSASVTISFTAIIVPARGTAKRENKKTTTITIITTITTST